MLHHRTSVSIRPVRPFRPLRPSATENINDEPTPFARNYAASRKQEDKPVRRCRLPSGPFPAERQPFFDRAGTVPRTLVPQRMDVFVRMIEAHFVRQDRNRCVELEARDNRLQQVRLAIAFERNVFEIQRFMEQARSLPVVPLLGKTARTLAATYLTIWATCHPRRKRIEAGSPVRSRTLAAGITRSGRLACS